MTARRRRSLARRSRVSAGLALTGLAVSACGGDRGAPPDALPAQSCASATAPYALEAPEPVWRYTLDDSIGFSVRVEDLDGDGEPEVLVPHGVEDPPSGGVVALSGETGEVVWTAPAEQQLYGSPVFLDVTGDGVKDVFAGGRNIEFLALDGASGQLVWRFEADGVVGSYNFYTAAFVPDQTGDGLAELLVANGGEDRALPPDPRPPGHLLVLDSATGDIVTWAETPDGRETYMSPLVLPAEEGNSEPRILLGTGGETWPGGLYRADLSRLLAGDLEGATPLVRTATKGVIAPPALADFDRDGTLDVLVATFEGSLVLLSGRTDRELWRIEFEGSESYTTPVLGYFDEDDVPDALVVFLRGTFPAYTEAVHAIVSGADGAVVWQESIGSLSMAGGVAIDLDADGFDEALLLASHADAEPDTEEQLHLLEPRTRSSRAFGPPLGSTLPVSPWVGELDVDGCVDLVVPELHTDDDGIRARVTRFRIRAPVPDSISWGGYLGTHFDAELRPRRQR